MKRIFALILSLLGFTCISHAQIITTIAGTDTAGYNGDNIQATAAQLFNPTFLTFDAVGNLYIADYGNARIRKIDGSGVVTTFAGTTSGGYNSDNIQATDAKLSNMGGIAFDNAGNFYIADDFNNRIRKINAAGIITTIAGTGVPGYSGDNGPGTDAKIHNPHGIAVDPSGNVYFADFPNNCVRKINPTGIITSFAGNGPGGLGDGGQATAATLDQPYGIALDGAGNLYIAEWGGGRIRKVNTAGIISTIAGKVPGGLTGDDIPATDAAINSPTGIAVDGFGNVYIAEAYANRIRVVSTDGIIRRVAGTGVNGYSGDGGSAVNAELNGPVGVVLDAQSNIYIAEFGNNTIRRIKSTVFTPEINVSKFGLSVYPNPTSGKVSVSILTVDDQQVVALVVSAIGGKIREFTIQTNTQTELQLSACSGIYFLIVRTSQGTLSQKILLHAESPVVRSLPKQ